MVGCRRIVFTILVWSAVTGTSAQRVPAEDPQTPPLDPAARKAVGKLLEDLFGEISKKVEQQADGNQSETVIPDPVDERALVNREQRAQLQRAQRMLEEGQRDGALRLLQFLLNSNEDSLLLTADGKTRSLQAVAEEVILGADSQTREKYEQRYGPVAEEQLQQARRAGSIRALAGVTRRYFATLAGAAAADEIASLMVDAGQPTEAAYWYQRLIASDAPLTRDPRWRLKVERVLKRAAVPADSPSRPPSERDAPADSRVQPVVRSDTSPALRQWILPFGGPTHRGRFAESNPVLIEHWTQPLSGRPGTVEQIAELIEDLQDGGAACIPAAVPLAVDDKIVFRTLRGLSVVDANSGRLLWELPEGVSIERLLAGEPALRPAADAGTSRLRPMSSYQGNGADQHALSHLLFRDGVYGLISSDGERVFVLEDHATLSYRPPGYYRGQSHDDDPHGRDWETNKLVAYDLDTGTRLWAVGGPEGNEPFHLELAGTLFQGPPVVEGDELFVIGEQHGAEVLFVLDRRTGEPLWSHMLSGVSAEIEYDLVRRWWPALPAVGKGVIICPTTVGWVVAVDRYEHRIRWAQRLTSRRKEQRYARQSSVAMASPLNSRWCPSAPILVGDRVLLTPSELPDAEYHSTPRIFCLETLTGQTAWKREKDTLLYVGGVFGESLVLVGTDRIEARRIADGQRIWRTSLPEVAGNPAGRGVITGTDYLLPLQSGELWRIDLNDGSVRAKSALSTLYQGRRMLGNLLVAGGKLISLTPFSVSCFEDRDSVEKLLAQAAADQLSPADRLHAAELQVIDREYGAAARLLREIDSTRLDEADAATVRDLHWRALVAVVESDPANATAELEELERMASGEQQRLSLRQLQAQHHVARGDHSAALNIFWSLAQISANESSLVEAGATSVRLDCWLAAQLRNVWTEMNPAARQTFDQVVESTVDELLQKSPDDWEWWARVLNFHPQGRRLEVKLADRAVDAARLAEAELRLVRLLDRRAPETSRTAALAKLLTLLDHHDRPNDANWYREYYAGPVAADDATGGDRFDRSTEELRHGEGASQPIHPRLDWSSDAFSLTRASLQFNQQSPDISLSIVDGLPSYDHLHVVLQPALGRLKFVAPDGSTVWETPLRSQFPSRPHHHSIASVTVGPLLFVVHQGVLHSVSVTDRDFLWQRPFDVRMSESASVMRSMLSPPDELAPANIFRTSHSLTRQQTDAALAVARPGYLCYFGRNSITAVDPLNGDILWTRRGILPRSVVAGNDRYLIVIPSGAGDPYALRVDDGSQVALPHLDTLLTSAIGVTDGGLVTLDADRSGSAEAGDEPVRLEVVDPLTGEAAWRTSFPQQTLFSRIEADTVLAIEPGGMMRLVNWTQRKNQVLGTLDQTQIEDASSICAISDRELIYLSLNERPDRAYRSDLYLSMPVNGPLFAIDRNGDGILWETSAENQHLLLDHLSRLPVLVLLSRHATMARPEINAQQVHLELLDKWAGRHLLDKSRYVSVGSFRSMAVDLTARIIDFHGSRERLRIQPSEAEPIPE